MADAKISALTSVTTPLAGTEVLPIVQSSSTKKVTVANLTAGRAVTADSLSVGTTDVFAKVGAQRSGGNSILARFNSSNKPAGIYTGGSSGESFIGANLEWSSGNVFNYKLNGMMWYLGDPGGGGSSVVLGIGSGTAGNTAGVDNASTVLHRWGTNGNYTIANGNLVIGTSGKGIDFSAHAHATGMTSELLNDYEEGTWTPSLVPGTSGSITLTTAAAKYTKVGRAVTVTGICEVASVSSPVGALLLQGLPYTNSADTSSRSAAAIYATGLAATATTSIVGRIIPSESQIRIEKFTAGSASALAGDVQTNAIIQFSLTYFV
jgi:hypothetical protein